MKRDLRIVFMGTPEFAVSILRGILDHGYNVVGVITAPDKPAGRGRKLHESAVKVFAKSHNLNIMQPTNLKSETFNETLRSLKPNLQVVVAFRMLPKVVWQMPEYGTFNLHASLLPNYRGAAPINWAIINGEKETGVSTFFIDEKIDTGEMILQDHVTILDEDTAGTLHDKLMLHGTTLVLDTLELIKNDTVTTKPQSESSDLKTAYKLNKENCKIDWNASITTIHNLIRGLSPYPAAWCSILNGDTTLDSKIYKSSFEFISHEAPIGKLIMTKNELKVAVCDGYINIIEMKLPGKRNMPIKALLNGFQFDKDAKML